MARHGVLLLVCTVLVLQSLFAIAETPPNGVRQADALLSIDQHRATVIDRIVRDWGDALAASGAGLRSDQLRTMLNGLRADQLLAASLAGTLGGLRNILAIAVASSAPVRGSMPSKALGDTADDLVYTPVSPCRLFDTRPSQGGAGVMQPNVRRSYGAVTPVTNQGGPGGCNAPSGAAVALIQIGTLTPSGYGYLQGGAQGIASFPNALILYQPGDQYGTAVAMPLNPANGEFDVQVQYAATDLYGDLLGYFKAPGGQYFMQGGNTFGATAKLGTLDNQPFALMVNALPALRVMSAVDASNDSTVNIVNGFSGNSVDAGFIGATISGGGFKRGLDSALFPNRVSGNFGTIGGGDFNAVVAYGGTVGGGEENTAGELATVAGGQFSTANGTLATVSGGEGNTASGSHSAIAGGRQNTASGLESTVAGGALNAASGGSSLAAGHRAQATATGSFAWADAQEFDFQVSAANFFGIRATGGVGLTVGINPTTGAVTEFCNLLPAATPSWACTSDRDVKEHFVPADGKDILQRLVAMPLFSWSMKNGDPAIRSLGPTAQDFFEAFALGKNDKTIASLNLEGVAIAAIKGLHQIVQEKEARIATLEQQVSELQSLRGELAALKATVAEMAIARERVANR